jgi:hypothetical protein
VTPATARRLPCALGICAGLVGLGVLAGLTTSCKKPRAPLRWAIGVTKLDATQLGLAHARTPDPFVDAIKPGRLVIPTYDGSNQATHPDVLLERDASGAAHITMAMTPYPFSNDRFENPSLLVSTDGMAFTAPPGVLAPLVPPPPKDHNDDPDIRLDPRTGEYEILYLETLRPERQTLVSLRSRDKVAWTRHDALVYEFKTGARFIVSPAAIDEAGKTYLYYVDAATRVMYMMISDDGRWDPATEKPLALELGAIHPWHCDVIRGEGVFGLLISGYDDKFQHQNLYLATSTDLVSWTLRPQPLLSWQDPALGVDTLYRSTGVVEHGTLVVWYAMQYRE